MGDEECGVWDVEGCGVWGVGCGVWGVGCGVMLMLWCPCWCACACAQVDIPVLVRAAREGVQQLAMLLLYGSETLHTKSKARLLRWSSKVCKCGVVVGVVHETGVCAHYGFHCVCR